MVEHNKIITEKSSNKSANSCEELYMDLEQEIATRKQLIGSTFSKLIKGTTEEGYTGIEIAEFEYPSIEYDVEILEKYRDNLQKKLGYNNRDIGIEPKAQVKYLTRFSPITTRLADNMKRESQKKEEFDISSVTCPTMIRVLDKEIKKIDRILDRKVNKELDRLQPKNPDVPRSGLKRLANLMVAGDPNNVPLIYQSSMIRNYRDDLIKKAKI